jgi:hypothetical protein
MANSGTTTIPKCRPRSSLSRLGKHGVGRNIWGAHASCPAVQRAFHDPHTNFSIRRRSPFRLRSEDEPCVDRGRRSGADNHPKPSSADEHAKAFEVGFATECQPYIKDSPYSYLEDPEGAIELKNDSGLWLFRTRPQYQATILSLQMARFKNQLRRIPRFSETSTSQSSRARCPPQRFTCTTTVPTRKPISCVSQK